MIGSCLSEPVQVHSSSTHAVSDGTCQMTGNTVFCLNFSSAGKEPIMASKAKNMYQALVVQKVDSTIQQINLYPLDSAIGFPKTYPMDSDF